MDPIQQIRRMITITKVVAAYRYGDYEGALQDAEGLKDGETKTATYCFFRGSMLYYLGRLEDAESVLLEGLPLEENPRKKAVFYEALASVLMNQQRFSDAIAFYEDSARITPDRGACQSGIAEVWLRQGKELPTALECARRGVEIDRRAKEMSGTPEKKEVTKLQVGEDLAVLAWAAASNEGRIDEVDSILEEAFSLCGSRSKPILGKIHFHAGKAYEALTLRDKAKQHFRQSAQSDPNGIHGRLACAVGA